MIFRTILLLCALVVSGPGRAADATFPIGSHIGLVPPDGMTASPSFPGFEDRDRKAAILLSQVPAPAYEQFLKSMNSGAINIPGVSNAKRELMLTDGGAAHLVVGDQEADGVKFRKWLMITRRSITGQGADPGFSFIVTAQVPEDASEVYTDDLDPQGARHRACCAVRSRQQEILDHLPFRLTELADFEGVKLIAPGRAVMLTERGGTSEPKNTEPIVMISAGAGAPARPDERAQLRDQCAAHHPGLQQSARGVAGADADARPARSRDQAGRPIRRRQFRSRHRAMDEVRRQRIREARRHFTESNVAR